MLGQQALLLHPLVIVLVMATGFCTDGLHNYQIPSFMD